MRLDIGGGTVPREGWVNLDPVHGEGDMRRRVEEGIPLPDDSVEEALASHAMEHIAAGHDRIAAMNEVWRVLKPGGTFLIIVPLFPNWQAVADPTHLSFWTYESFCYFTGMLSASADYGIRQWEWVSYGVAEGWEGHAVLRKPD